MEDKKVQELADTLKERGLAASMADAIEKAKNIMYGIAPTPKTIDKPKVQKTIERNNSEELEQAEKDISSLESQQDNFQQKFNPNNPNYDIGKETGTLGEMMEKFEKNKPEPQVQPMEQQPMEQVQPHQPQAEIEQPIQPQQVHPKPEPMDQTPEPAFKEETNFIGTMDEESEHFYDEEPEQLASEPQPMKQQPMQERVRPQPVHPEPEFPEQQEIKKELPLTQDLLKEEEKPPQPTTEPTQPVQPQVQPQQTREQIQPRTVQQPVQSQPEKKEEEKSGLTKEEKEKTDLSKIFNFGNR